MRQLYWLCRAFGIVRGFRKFFIDGDSLTEWEIEVRKTYRRP